MDVRLEASTSSIGWIFGGPQTDLNNARFGESRVSRIRRENAVRVQALLVGLRLQAWASELPGA